MSIYNLLICTYLKSYVIKTIVYYINMSKNRFLLFSKKLLQI